MNGNNFWWIALNDVAAEGEFNWPVGGAANFTYWDESIGEPFPDPNHLANCVEMQSAEWYSLLWMTYYCDDTENIFPVCQMPMPETSKKE